MRNKIVSLRKMQLINKQEIVIDFIKKTDSFEILVKGFQCLYK